MKDLDRRGLLRAVAAMGGGTALTAMFPGWAQSATRGLAELPSLTGPNISLDVTESHLEFDGRMGHVVTVNGTVPAPLLRLKQGQNVRLSVTNRLKEETSIHWHGLLVPPQMDGVPGVSFPGIKPGETFVYEFPIIQSGTYWYHSHSGLQEQMGHYGPIIIDPADADPVQSDREYVVMLSDFTYMHPHMIFARLKQEAGAFNYQRQTVAGLLKGEDQTLAERLDWAKMLMDPTDISDVTGAALKFLVNGHGPDDNWTALFNPGERVRLRFINAGAQMVFNVRIPGLKMTVVAADGQLVRPVEVDEFQIGNAETYDVIVHPTEDKAFTIMSEAVDRSGYGRATLAPRAGMTAEVPPLRKRPIGNMRDMGMDMGSMGGMSMEGGVSPGDMSGMKGMDHGSMDMSGMAEMKAPVAGMAPPKPRGSDTMGDMKGGGMQMDMSMRNPLNAPGVKMGPGVQTIAPMPVDRTGEAGQGLDSVGHRVLVYKDLVSLQPNPDPRTPTRAMDIHLTGNMERFIWGFDGVKFSDSTKPYTFEKGERVRVTLINDTMMAHPIHLHGHFFDLVIGAPNEHKPRKHTVIVLPGGRVSWDFTAEPGDWAFHCHMLYHMHAGMFQVFAVRPFEGAAQ
ncbi:copper resistance system multicopper oxidase [Asticcacaulis excentricus]|uniref:Copper-resistance protein, CopA family n=1 Tax=Asticcacaulis excentricus (strain ATCC 15261 / DSM 4724 / KCTC 12464 / NCIMB 9791 / VKM B-1370 / CB 48) TaxID=573065 RepID=E8RW17_ASTEC|nr:copper resistance system multicopper oxidase [Asticcacaulis excentricus]ADU15439.1 copper-resistance protein, CopA family [Asticcacaulis excentricus CB 48]